MSRVGKRPVTLPEKVTVAVKDGAVQVKGPKGELKYEIVAGIKVEQKGTEVIISPVKEGGATISAKWGLVRALVQNMVTGVSKGFERELEFNGVGYKAAVAGNILNLSLGYSHKIDFPLPKGVSATVNQNKIILSGCDRELLGHTAAKIRAFRAPEPYKGKGIKYMEEVIIRKAGKTGAKKA